MASERWSLFTLLRELEFDLLKGVDSKGIPVSDSNKAYLFTYHSS